MSTAGPTVIALDVDGTLFDGRTVDPSARQALAAASAAGHTLVLVTGRPWSDLPLIVPEVLTMCSVAVCEHGAVLADVVTGEKVHLGEPVRSSVSDEIAASAPSSLVRYEVTLGLPAELRQLAERACAAPGAGCYVVGNKDSLAVVPNGIDKGSGLEAAIRHLGLAASRVVAIGDAANDLPMFAFADVAVAVANADHEVVSAGVRTTLEPYGRGVAEALTGALGLAPA